MDDFDLEIKKEFVNEALSNLQEAEEAFMELESSSDKDSLLNKIFRLAHNLKGGSRAVGFSHVAEFTHEMESFVLKIQKKEIELNSDVVTVLLRCNDRLIEMLTALSTDMSATQDSSDLLEEMSQIAKGAKNTSSSALALNEVVASEAEVDAVSDAPNLDVPATFTANDATKDVPSEEANEALPPAADDFFASSGSPEQLISNESAVSAPVSEAKVATKETIVSVDAKAPTRNATIADEIVRVSLSKIERLNDLVGELIVLQSVITEQSRTNSHAKLNASIGQMVKLSKEVQGISMSLRMLPVKPLVQKLQRAVRDTAKSLAKEVNFRIVGEHIEIEKTVLDSLADPLIHILRNAVDHGLEENEARIKAGKQSQGQVTLTFQNDGNNLVVEVRDDGHGINTTRVREKAIEKKIINPDVKYSEKEIINLIFHAGFSTKSQTSEISGRGVGMDVVKSNLQKVGGEVDVTTELNVGSVFRIQVPLSLAVIEGLVVTSKTSRYVVPIDQVKETINLSSLKMHKKRSGIGNCFELRGEVVPIYTIEEAFGTLSNEDIIDGTVLITHLRDKPIGLLVSDILRSQQVVVKPIGNGIRRQNGIIGSCVLGDGVPSIIIKPQDLLATRINFYNENQKLGDVA